MERFEKVRNELKELKHDLVKAQAGVEHLKLLLITQMMLVEQIKQEIDSYGSEN